MIKRPALLLLLALGACNSGQDDGVGGVSAAEASALNAAAAQLDARAGAASPQSRPPVPTGDRPGAMAPDSKKAAPFTGTALQSHQMG